MNSTAKIRQLACEPSFDNYKKMQNLLEQAPDNEKGILKDYVEGIVSADEWEDMWEFKYRLGSDKIFKENFRVYVEKQIEKAITPESSGWWRKYDFFSHIYVGSLVIEITCNETIDLEFSHLKKISEIFQTDIINTTDEDYTSGCITCDHGATYELTLSIKDYKIPREIFKNF